MTLSVFQYLLGACSGSLVGLALGLFGGGGSILNSRSRTGIKKRNQLMYKVL